MQITLSAVAVIMPEPKPEPEIDARWPVIQASCVEAT